MKPTGAFKGPCFKSIASKCVPNQRVTWVFFFKKLTANHMLYIWVFSGESTRIIWEVVGKDPITLRMVWTWKFLIAQNRDIEISDEKSRSGNQHDILSDFDSSCLPTPVVSCTHLTIFASSPNKFCVEEPTTATKNMTGLPRFFWNLVGARRKVGVGKSTR